MGLFEKLGNKVGGMEEFGIKLLAIFRQPWALAAAKESETIRDDKARILSLVNRMGQDLERDAWPPDAAFAVLFFVAIHRMIENDKKRSQKCESIASRSEPPGIPSSGKIPANSSPSEPVPGSC